MKIISFIFSFYFFTLAIIPCCDETECNELEQTTIAQSQDHSTHQHENEICSPFCICSCCGGITIITETVSTGTEIVTTELQAVSSNSKLLSVYLAIWQPPKTG